MYHGTGAALGVAGIGAGIAQLPDTGGAALWIFLAGFALVAAGGAIWRTIPRNEK